MYIGSHAACVISHFVAMSDSDRSQCGIGCGACVFIAPAYQHGEWGVYLAGVSAAYWPVSAGAGGSGCMDLIA